MPTNDSSPETLLQQRVAQLEETIASLSEANAQLQQKLSRQALLNTIIQAMRGTLVLDEVLQTTVDKLHEALLVSRCLIFRPNAQNQMAASHVSEATDDRNRLLGVGGDLFFDCYNQNLAGGEPGVLPQIDASSPPLVGACGTEYGIRAALVVPLICKDSYIGAISLHQCDRPRQWTDDDISFVQAIAAHCAIAIQQAELYQQGQTELALRQETKAALQQAKEQLQAVLDAVPGFVSWVDADGRYRGVNRHLATAFNLSPEAFVGQKLGFKKSSPQFALFMRQFLASPTETASQVIEAQVKGELRHYLIVAQKYQQGSAAVSVGIDISDRIKAEAALQDSLNQIRLIADNLPVLISYLDNQLRYQFFNKQYEVYFGLPATEILGKHVQELLGAANYAKVQPYIEAALSGEKVSHEYAFARMDGQQRHISLTLVPHAREVGGVLGYFALIQDITERKLAEDKLRQAEAKYRLLVEQIPAIVFTAPLDNLSSTTYISPQVERILGFTPEEYLADSEFWRRHIHPDDRDRVLTSVQQSQSTEPISLEYRMIARDGDVVWFRDVANFLQDETNQPLLLMGVMVDITELKQTEEALRESELKFRTLAETIPAATFIYQDTKICYVNPATTAITDYTEQELLSMNFWDFLHPDMQEFVRERGLACLRGEQVCSKYEAKIITKNGEVRWVEIAGKVIEFEGKPAMLGTAFDITSRKQVEEALYKRQQEFEALAENSPDIIARFDKNLRHLYVNRAIERATGISPHSFIGKNHQELGMPESQASVWQQALQKVFVTGQPEVYGFDFPTPDGMRYYQSRLVPEFAKDGSVEFILGITHDITEQKQAEEQIKASLRDKEVLLKEVHHRVKNNLQVISSLLDLQSLQIQDPQTLEIFQASQNRVKSMALIHEKLYQSPNLDRINFANYLQHLTTHLLRTYAVNSDNITLHLNLQEISLNVDTAVPCGLIVNELVSNSLKHAFGGQKQGRIWLELKSENNQITLAVRDDGIKLSDGLERLPEKSLGMQLINALVGQIQGKLELNCRTGTAFKIIFYELKS